MSNNLFKSISRNCPLCSLSLRYFKRKQDIICDNNHCSYFESKGAYYAFTKFEWNVWARLDRDYIRIIKGTEIYEELNILIPSDYFQGNLEEKIKLLLTYQ